MNLVHRLEEHQQKEKNNKQISLYYEHIEEKPTHEIDYVNIQV